MDEPIAIRHIAHWENCSRLFVSFVDDVDATVTHCSIIALQNLHREIEAHYFVVKPSQDEQRVCWCRGIYSSCVCVCVDLAWHCMECED